MDNKAQESTEHLNLKVKSQVKPYFIISGW